MTLPCFPVQILIRNPGVGGEQIELPVRKDSVPGGLSTVALRVSHLSQQRQQYQLYMACNRVAQATSVTSLRQVVKSKMTVVSLILRDGPFGIQWR